jgi:hypothetical protein
MPVATCDGDSSAPSPALISKKRRRRCRRAKTMDDDGPLAAPHARLLGCPCTSGSAHNQLYVCPHANDLGNSILTAALRSGSSGTPGDLRRRRMPILERQRLSTSMASRLFKAVGVGVAMLRLSLIARGDCRLRSSVSASTVWRGTTSPLGVPPHPVASSVSARGTGRGTASFVDRPGAFP